MAEIAVRSTRHPGAAPAGPGSTVVRSQHPQVRKPSCARCLALVLVLCLACLNGSRSHAQTAGGGLTWSIGYDPTTLDPAKVDDEASELVRYLTAGVLLRTDRNTQQAEPSLAAAWNVSPDGRTVTFHLRQGLLFSDGSPLAASDVAWSIRRVLAAATAAPVAEEFLNASEVKVDTPDALTVLVHLPKRLVEIGHIFDEIAIEPENRPSQGRITAGPYTVAEYQRGRFLRLERNPHFWKRDGAGTPLPYLPWLQLDLIASAEQEQVRFQHGQYGLLNTVSPEYFNLLARSNPRSAHDLGPSLNTEQLWFNQASGSPLPAYEKQWFSNTAFRVAVSRAIRRSDLARLAYAGHATPAYGFVSPANRAWYLRELDAPGEDPAAARELLARSGFRRSEAGGKAILYDAAGHPVRFSILTNAGNAPRQRMAAMIQQDLRELGIEVTVVTLDFPALIDRLMHTQDYEACILGLSNVDPDPNSMMNVWLSSSPNHQWNPSEKVPATAWEAAVDSEMRIQASAADRRERLRAIRHVQQILAAEQPFIYLVYPNALYAVAPGISGTSLSVLQPGVVWNIESLRWSAAKP